MRRCLGIAGSVFVLLVCAQVQGDVTFQAGDTVVVLASERCWTVRSVSRSGQWYLEPVNSGQGTVVREDGTWVGSVHGSEQLLETSLSVDGVVTPFQDGESYGGQKIVFRRRTLLGRSYELVSTMEISDDALTERVRLQRTDVSCQIDLAYGFLGTRANRLIEYAGYDEGGEVLMTGRTDRDDMVNTYLRPSVAAAQYDPDSCDGLLSMVTVGCEYDLEPHILDRPYDNKLYMRFRDLEGPGDPGAVFELEQRLVFFAADDEWVEYAAAFVPQPPRIYGDANFDAMVDVQDLTVLAASWSMLSPGPKTWADGDFSYDGVVDIVDLTRLAANWSFAGSGSSTPEPGTLATLVLGGAVLLRRKRDYRPQAKIRRATP